MKLVDTSVALDHLRGTPAAVNLLRRLTEEDEPLMASEIVRFELLAGVRNDEVDALEKFFAALTWVSIDESIARAAGALGRQHRTSQGRIDDAHYLIAATALVLGADLLTTNVRQFPMLAGLRAAY